MAAARSAFVESDAARFRRRKNREKHKPANRRCSGRRNGRTKPLFYDRRKKRRTNPHRGQGRQDKRSRKRVGDRSEKKKDISDQFSFRRRQDWDKNCS